MRSIDRSAVDPEAVAALSEEEQIESAKYLPRHFPKRLFEEERFIFPETYGVNRVRLLVKDPQWLFAYWDLDPRAVNDLRNELGERALALTRLTLRIADPAHGGASVILLPYGARAWYVRADAAARTYKAQIGWTLPSGEFRMIAESNPATTPRLGPSPVRAARRMRFTESPEALARAGAAEAAEHPGPLGATPGAHGSEGKRGGKKRPRGGASDVYRR